MRWTTQTRRPCIMRHGGLSSLREDLSPLSLCRTGEDEERQADIITMLLHAKAYIEARDHNGCTALMFAVANGNEASLSEPVKSSHLERAGGHSALDPGAGQREQRPGAFQVNLHLKFNWRFGASAVLGLSSTMRTTPASIMPCSSTRPRWPLERVS